MAGKETSAEAYHPSQAAQRSRATAQVSNLLGGLRLGMIESGVKRALAVFRGGLVKPAPRVTLRVGWLPYHLGGSFVQNNRQQNEQLTGCFIYDLVMSLVNLIYR